LAEERQFVVFKLAEENYGLPIDQVREINRLTEITRLPQTPQFVEGIINLRGGIIPIIDLRKRLMLPASNTDNTRIIVVDVEDHSVGIIVDYVTEVLHLSSDNIDAPPPSLVIDAAYLEGIGKIDNRLVMLLKIDKILTSEEQSILNVSLG